MILPFKKVVYLIVVSLSIPLICMWMDKPPKLIKVMANISLIFKLRLVLIRLFSP